MREMLVQSHLANTTPSHHKKQTEGRAQLHTYQHRMSKAEAETRTGKIMQTRDMVNNRFVFLWYE